MTEAKQLETSLTYRHVTMVCTYWYTYIHAYCTSLSKIMSNKESLSQTPNLAVQPDFRQNPSHNISALLAPASTSTQTPITIWGHQRLSLLHCGDKNPFIAELLYSVVWAPVTDDHTEILAVGPRGKRKVKGSQILLAILHQGTLLDNRLLDVLQTHFL